MECKKIEDMMQLYVEDLCSEESKLWIESHVKECSECKKKLERLQQEKKLECKQDEKQKGKATIDEDALEKELKPFKKLRRKLWFRCVLDVVVILAVVTLLVCMVALGVTGWHKIENYALEKHGKEVVSYLVDGDIDKFVTSLDLDKVSLDLVDGQDEFLEDCKKDITEFYESELEGEKVEINVEVEREYPNYGTYPTNTLYAMIKNSKKEFCMSFTEGDGGLNFSLIYDTGKEDEEIPQFAKMNMVSIASFYRNRVLPKMADLDEEYADQEEAPFLFSLGLVDNYEDSESEKESWNKLRALMKEGICIEKSGCSGLYYDGESKEMYTTLMWELKDADGGHAYLEQEVRVPNLKIRDTETQVISDGCSEETVDKLKQIFH